MESLVVLVCCDGDLESYDHIIVCLVVLLSCQQDKIRRLSCRIDTMQQPCNYTTTNNISSFKCPNLVNQVSIYLSQSNTKCACQ